MKGCLTTAFQSIQNSDERNMVYLLRTSLPFSEEAFELLLCHATSYTDASSENTFFPLPSEILTNPPHPHTHGNTPFYSHLG